MDEVRKRLPVAIKHIQGDSDSQFGSHFTWHLEDLRIEHKPVPVGRPQTNGKVGRSHRTDQDELYEPFSSRGELALRRPLSEWGIDYNDRLPPLTPKGRTPTERFLGLRVRPLPSARVSA